ncbi:RluA family pseudouridine synthase [Clostridium botulinum]|uniref:Pseudouridine synthase n=1 Tax=Clostridium botulinum (strain Hall / ATCC 3502 / NCTC 13319 / Type A) TaxID=441771 RepID=A5I1V5_CLOBH|nr:RluA family pseudouridine synthase [Clostridium botulinum]EPS46873.1 ribosomal large subunit pseudouridine synthase D [Clostridium botulinum CFSAN002367]KRU30417.1 RNA pseudouridine synthase [Clostridium sporogenes]ABS35793.1 pseudouridine synthase, RluA family [Clostridium botulinum A str. ATCC 19397]ABS36584.1 pseudouridine synthase, RluA family [Clostridium botulinum A str. Hall]APH21559.1 pseudouridine synthase, RluA family protein [Clostridium botulinum]
MEKINLQVEKEFDNVRLDLYLSKIFEDKSRSYLQGIIDEGNVLVNNKEKKRNYKLKVGDNIEVNIPEPKLLQIEPEDIKLDIIYEDKDVIVVNKPQEMVVHPAPGVYSGTLVNALLHHCKDLSGINGVARPGIVHRIDKDTSGILVVAKNDISHNNLAAQFKEHSISRVYMALVEGIIKDEQGTIEAPIGRHPVDRIKMAVVKDGRHAVTHYKVIERFKNHTLVECRLETGRTHQIRVHMSHIMHPLVGDPVYGYKKQRFNLKGQMLHAKLLGFIHPTTRQYVEFESELPEYFKKIIKILKNELI